MFYFFTILTLHLFLSTFTEKVSPRMCPYIISKEEWGARSANQLSYTVFPIEYVIIHHSFTPSCNNKLECSQLLTNMQNFHMNALHFDDIAYNFMIGGDGKVYEGRGWHKIGAHTRGYNSKSVGIAFLGTFTDKLPTNTQLKIAQDLIQCGVEMGELSSTYKLFGARQLSGTRSPGFKLYNEIRKWRQFTLIAGLKIKIKDTRW